MPCTRVVALAVLCLVSAERADAQSVQGRFELGAQVTSVSSGQFDATDTGFGGRVSWRPGDVLGFEAELNVFPQDFPDDPPFSRGRLEALFGATAGVTFGRIRPFARLRPGFVSVRESPEPFACILIFPPPLPCALASGQTLTAIDLGGGIEITTTARTFVRVDIGDRLLRYPGPVFDANRVIRERPFFVHEFRFAGGAGVRF
jgi:outer membrane protein with beta-barrel domain